MEESNIKKEYYTSLWLEYLFRLNVCFIVNNYNETIDYLKYNDIMNIVDSTPIPLVLEHDIGITFRLFLCKMSSFKDFILMKKDNYKKHFYIFKINEKWYNCNEDNHINKQIDINKFMNAFDSKKMMKNIT